jgi:hypothetical protein
VSAHAMNNNGPVAKIVERDGWRCRMDFAGHRKAITVVVCIASGYSFLTKLSITQ